MQSSAVVNSWQREPGSLITRRTVLVEAIIALAIFASAAWWGDRYWQASAAAGRQPFFYQQYFEPAVMMACGNGFVVADPPVRPLVDFLERRTDRFRCDELPANAKLGTNGLYQGAWRYLMIATAIAWRILGISWSGLGPFVGVLFATTIVCAYGILRLGMGRALSAFGAFGLTLSTMHLLNLPAVRDYAKAPFTLALIFILGVMVVSQPNRRVLFLSAAAYGLVLGVAYGFRTDFLICVPLFLIVLFGFVSGGVSRNLRRKTAAAALFLAVFLAVGWPIISVVYRDGGCQWHTALLGLTIPFTEMLDVEPAPYDWGHAYEDGFVYKTVSSYARVLDPQAGRVPYCSHAYDVFSGRYMLEVARRFPADLATRASASTLQIIDLPFSRLASPIPDFWPSLYQARTIALGAVNRIDKIVVAAAIVLVMLTNLRLGLFLVFFLAYFGGYPAIQFANRHYFHLEFITWWAFGFVVQSVVAGLVLARRPDMTREPAWSAASVRRGAVALVAVVAFQLGSLWLLRAYQQREVRQFLERYLAAPREAISIEAAAAGTVHPVPPRSDADPETLAQFIEVDLNEWKCGERPSVGFQYDPAFPLENLSRTVVIERHPVFRESTRIVVPVFRHFAGVTFSDVSPGCLGGVFRVPYRPPMTLMVGAVLPPRWHRMKLYQRIASGQSASARP